MTKVHLEALGDFNLYFIFKIRSALSYGWCSQTSFHPSIYQYAGCLSYGQCWVTARVMHEVFGWGIVVNKKDGNNHYWNILPDGTQIDFTSDQGGGNGYNPILDGKISKRRLRPIAQCSNIRLKLYYSLVSEALFALKIRYLQELSEYQHHFGSTSVKSLIGVDDK